MPIYEYACRRCDHQFDALQKMSDAALTECPGCGEASLRKLLSAPKFRLKGQGWYETDFKTGDKRNIAGDSDKSTDSNGDSKPADKKETKKDSKKETKAVTAKSE